MELRLEARQRQARKGRRNRARPMTGGVGPAEAVADETLETDAATPLASGNSKPAEPTVNRSGIIRETPKVQNDNI